MRLEEALNLAKDGCFVTNQYFDSNQSLHFFNGIFYYEDGAVVTEEFLEQQAFAQGDSWSVKHFNCSVDYSRLKEMHENSRGLMLRDTSYEEAVIKTVTNYSTCYKRNIGRNSKEDIANVIKAAKNNMRLKYKS